LNQKQPPDTSRIHSLDSRTPGNCHASVTSKVTAGDLTVDGPSQPSSTPDGQNRGRLTTAGPDFIRRHGKRVRTPPATICPNEVILKGSEGQQKIVRKFAGSDKILYLQAFREF
jgi:hypothetical protein